jgi:hypothetical protein
VIEQVPQELRDRFTEMRELDLSVQSKKLIRQMWQDPVLIFIMTKIKIFR